MQDIFTRNGIKLNLASCPGVLYSIYMDAVEEIKARLSVEDVISEYIELKRAGRNLKGLSPFQAEKTPSFMVSPDKQIWHDFSSNKGGNMFSFIMEMEGVDFRGALEILARKAGVDLEVYGRSKSNSKLKDKLSEVLEVATKYFQQNLVKNPGSLEYLVDKRRFNKDDTEFSSGLCAASR